jgi:hypothetical protein
MPDFAEIILGSWVLHVCIALLLSYPFLRFGWKRAAFHRWEAWALVLPYALWFVSLVVNLSMGHGKSLTNMFVEPLFISGAIAAAAAIRIGIGNGRHAGLAALVLLGCLCIASFGIDCLTTGWPE